MRTTIVATLFLFAGASLAASPDPIRLSTGDLAPEAFPQSKQILLEEMSADGRYGPVPERHKRKIREALASIETMLADPQAASGIDVAIQAEADEINDILERADSRVGKGRCEERKPMGSNIRMRTVCRDSATMAQQRETAQRTMENLNRCAQKDGGLCGFDPEQMRR